MMTKIAELEPPAGVITAEAYLAFERENLLRGGEKHQFYCYRF
jgi:hypothetical protein